MSPPDARGHLKNLMRNKFPHARDVSDIPDGEHRAFDVMNNIKLYNMVFYLTQRIVYTFSLTPKEAKVLVNCRYDERALVRMIVNDPTCPFLGTVLPLYDGGYVENITYGPYVVQTVLTYFNTHDRAVLDMGSRELCYNLLYEFIGDGVLKLDHFTDHPPVPTSKRFYPHNSTPPISFYQYPVPDFEVIRYLDNDGGPMALEPVDDPCDPPFIKRYTGTEHGRDHCFIFVDLFPPPQPLVRHAVNVHIDEFDKIKSSVRTKVVFVFRNKNALKAYTTLYHVLDKRVTRIHSLVLYVEKVVDSNAKKEFMTHVMPYQ
jgi:hypothetical protein